MLRHQRNANQNEMSRQPPEWEKLKSFPILSVGDRPEPKEHSCVAAGNVTLLGDVSQSRAHLSCGLAPITLQPSVPDDVCKLLAAALNLN